MLCMLNMGMPQSTVRIPERVAIIGPIVDPHPESDLWGIHITSLMIQCACVQYTTYYKNVCIHKHSIQVSISEIRSSPHAELLHRHGHCLANLSQQRCRHCVSGIPLVRIVLDNQPAVYLWGHCTIHTQWFDTPKKKRISFCIRVIHLSCFPA